MPKEVVKGKEKESIPKQGAGATKPFSGPSEATEDYELFPHKLLAGLQEEVDEIRRQLTAPNTPIQQLTHSIEELKQTISTFNQGLKQALDAIKEDSSLNALQQLSRKLDTVIEQDNKLAEGILAVSDRIGEVCGTAKARLPQQQAARAASKPPSPFAPSAFGQPARTAPSPFSEQPPSPFAQPSSPFAQPAPQAPLAPLPLYGEESAGATKGEKRKMISKFFT